MRSLCRKPQKLSDRYCGRVCDRFAENLKNKAIAYCPRMSDRLTENLKNKAIACYYISGCVC
ncbi:hypothetical protein [Nostoc sp.]|uniref:hypothetical protein n=1 Tax=Nostoc sp. TaxID=1180 RepID=UPI002FF6ED2D